MKDMMIEYAAVLGSVFLFSTVLTRILIPVLKSKKAGSFDPAF